MENKMTEQGIVDGNKLIAEFMGYEANRVEQDRVYRNKPGETTVEQCRYHESWDWLIPAVANLRESLQKIPFSHKHRFFLNNDLLAKAVLSHDIDCAFNFMVESLTWFNEIKNKL